MGLRVDTVKVSGVGLHLTHEPFSITTDAPGTLEVFVDEKDMAELLNKMAPAGLKNVSIEAKNSVLHIRATKTLLIDLKAYAVCSLRIVGGQKLFVDLESVEILGSEPKQLIQTQLNKINPVIDLADFPFEATLETVEIGRGGIHLKGRVEPPK